MMRKRLEFVRQALGTFCYDWPRLAWCLRPGSRDGWIRMRNREDVLQAAPVGPGVRCAWDHTRPLHLCAVFPRVGRWLMSRALSAWPVRQAVAPVPCGGGTPDVSFLVGHSGVVRVPLLLATLRSIAAQEQVAVECIVAEQGERSALEGVLPPWVRHVFLPAAAGAPFNRARAFNAAAAEARGELLVLHDSDLLAPAAYAAEHVRIARQGFDVVSLKRFIFYLAGGEDGGRIGMGAESVASARVVMVLENATGGGSLALTRQSFERIGGMDESFEGWGGEDMEFWDRCLTQRVWLYAHLPLVHLWHADQPGKRAIRGLGSLTAELTETRRRIDPQARIRELVGRAGRRVESGTAAAQTDMFRKGSGRGARGREAGVAMNDGRSTTG